MVVLVLVSISLWMCLGKVSVNVCVIIVFKDMLISEIWLMLVWFSVFLSC